MINIKFSKVGKEAGRNHFLYNHNVWDVKLSAWSMSVMTARCRVIISNEDYYLHLENLVSVRPLVLWHFTNMDDPTNQRKLSASL